MTDRLLVSIVVPARNEAASIESCLGALRSQDYPEELLEFLVVDGNSTDDTVDRVNTIAGQDPRVRLLHNRGQITPLAFNLGIHAAKGDVIGVMSAHGVPASDYVGRAVHALGETGAWCVGGRIDRTAATGTQRAIARATSSPFGVGDAAHNYAAQPRWVETAFPGLWPRWVFERVGLFDPELVRNQDDEMSYRIRQAGGSIWYDPSIVVRYEPRESYSALFSQYRQYAMWKLRVFQKHPRAARPRHLIPPAWVASIAVGLAAWPATAVGPLIAVAAISAYGLVMSVAVRRIDHRGTTRAGILRALITLHLAYGVGFWQGVVRFAPRWFRDRRGAIQRLGERGPT